jgi:hypothetical protein
MNRFKVKMVRPFGCRFRSPCKIGIDLCVAQSAQEGQRRQEQRSVRVRHRLARQGRQEERQARQTCKEREAAAGPSACVARASTDPAAKCFPVAGSSLRRRHLLTRGTSLCLTR